MAAAAVVASPSLAKTHGVRGTVGNRLCSFSVDVKPREHPRTAQRDRSTGTILRRVGDRDDDCLVSIFSVENRAHMQTFESVTSFE